MQFKSELLDMRINYQTAVYFRCVNKRTSLKLYTTTSHRLNRSFRYFCVMCTKLCQANHKSLVLLYLSMVQLLQNWFVYLAVIKTKAKIMKALAMLCLKLVLFLV